MEQENDGRQTLSELIIGIVILAVIITIVGVFLSTNKFAFVMGMLLGVVVAIIMGVSMYRSLDRSLELDTTSAVGYMKRNVFLRVLLIVGAIAAAIIAAKYISTFGVIIGILCLKLSAYLQPLTHRLFNRIR